MQKKCGKAARYRIISYFGSHPISNTTLVITIQPCLRRGRQQGRASREGEEESESEGESERGLEKEGQRYEDTQPPFALTLICLRGEERGASPVGKDRIREERRREEKGDDYVGDILAILPSEPIYRDPAQSRDVPEIQLKRGGLRITAWRRFSEKKLPAE